MRRKTILGIVILIIAALCTPVFAAAYEHEELMLTEPQDTIGSDAEKYEDANEWVTGDIRYAVVRGFVKIWSKDEEKYVNCGCSYLADYETKTFLLFYLKDPSTDEQGMLIFTPDKIYSGDIYPSCEAVFVNYDNFRFIAVIDKENSHYSDPADTRHTRYFSTDAEEIKDIEKYIRSRGADPSDGTYTPYLRLPYLRSIGRTDGKFQKIEPVIGGLDIEGSTGSNLQRIRVGKTGHYLGGKYHLTEGKGSWIEDENGVDLYNYRPVNDGTYREIGVIDAKNETYVVTRTAHGDEGGWQKIDGSFNTLENGWSIGGYESAHEYSYLRPWEIEIGRGKKKYTEIKLPEFLKNLNKNNTSNALTYAPELDIILSCSLAVIVLLIVLAVLRRKHKKNTEK